ncbi:ribosomal protein S11, mitochondrial [Bombus pyrosoma]|uniref:ribosomal protein S11, mitochondrial n=1 Tax=Bombus pyrosoma TaxID=396416 RepID=UPI001CB90E24|nr:ribosomal protein S11, mitochondrial [Bombus pyrosoma]
MILSTLQSAVGSLTRSTILSNGKFTVLPYLKFTNVRDIHITSNTMREFRVGNQKVRASETGKHVIMEGETTTNMTSASESKVLFPDASTQYKLYNGVRYDHLHIINIKSTPNNTIMSLTDYKGMGKMLYSAGIEGFKNTKKGTNIAAQQAAFTFGTRIFKSGVKTVRLRVQGIGPGRMGALKGLQLTNLQVVSVTDDTRVSWNPQRPRKQRRI